MPLSHIIKSKCSVCDSTATETSRIEFDNEVLISLSCGHIVPLKQLKSSDENYYFESSDGKQLRPYQVEGVKFAENSGIRTLIADEQGLGKTIQALALIKLHREQLIPAVIFTKTTVKRQWFFEVARWCKDEGLICQVLQSGKEKCLPGFDVYILSYDLAKVEGIFSMVEGTIKYLVIDECQAIKNHLSGRAKAIQDISRSVPHIVATSGTPIKNNAGEYFTILNILQPQRFSELQSFLDKYCDYYETQYGYKVGGLSDQDRFKEDTKDFIIRRTRAEAAPEIPEVDRQFFHVELDKKMQKAYVEGLKELEELMYQEEDEDTNMNKLAIIAKMRKIVGISKVADCIEFVTEFLLNEPSKKLTIFCHHHDVVTLLVRNLDKWLTDGGYLPCLNLHSGLNGNERAELVEKFKSDDKRRILVASTLAAGEGLNLQFCSRAVMLERQWNPANEEQAEGRFARIGQEDNIVVTYMIASETIDDYFTEIVETKRAIMKNTLDGKEMQWDEAGLLKELTQVLVQKGRKAWRL